MQLRHEIGRLLCNSSAKAVPPTHRGCMLTSNKLFKYTAKNQSTRNSGSSSQHEHCEASVTQSGHDLLTTRTSDTNNTADSNKAVVNSTTASMTMTMANDATTVDNNDVTNIAITVAMKKPHRRLLVDNNIIVTGKNDALIV